MKIPTSIELKGKQNLSTLKIALQCIYTNVSTLKGNQWNTIKAAMIPIRNHRDCVTSVNTN